MALVLTAAALWGTLGTLYTFGRERYGLEPLTIVFWRAALASLSLGLVLAATLTLSGRGFAMLRIRRRDIPLFVAYGLLGGTAFFLLYIYAVLYVGVAVAVVLLYTSPAIVAILAWRFLGERFTRRKIVALVTTLLGCALVAGVVDSAQSINLVGIVCGLGSALTYALYSIFGKVSLQRGYPVSTMILYVYGIGTLGLLAVALAGDARALFSMGWDAGAWTLLLMLGTVQTLGTLALYTTGLRYLDAGVAGIVATFELVVAALLAFIVLQEPLSPAQIAGGMLIAASVLILGMGRSR